MGVMIEVFTWNQWIVLLLFVIGYLCIIFEHALRVNKTTVALLTATACWVAYFLGPAAEAIDLALFHEELAETAQIVFFLLAALAIVETIQVHGGLNLISRLFVFPSKKVILWVIGFVTFFLSSILDNLTTTIVMIMLIRKLLEDPTDRMIFGSIIVIAANAGGAWTPIGDVTTTMLWVGGQISSAGVMKSLFMPSMACLVTSLLVVGRNVTGQMPSMDASRSVQVAPYARPVLFCGLLALLGAPILRSLTGLPPFMGILTGMALLWLMTDYVHYGHPERDHLRMPSVLTRIDITSLLFFLGILLTVGSLRIDGILEHFANNIDVIIPYKEVVAVFIGFLSSIVDNVPLVAACMGMYKLAIYPMDNSFWMLSAYCAGTGGSLLIIGSAAGVAFMGLEKVDFFWYVRKASIPALAGYLAGIAVYTLQLAVS
jgi:Na+/H+ antiporter NhaD/arsenite permease-like protein